MCGICGFIGNGGVEDLQEMNGALIHRGPDEEGLWFDEKKGVFLGHRRLSIIDLEHGSQPMWSGDDSVCVICNGEIYNHLELRKDLESKGHRFRTDHADTEALIYGYKEWGEDLPHKLNGMWAFALYDKKRHRIFLSRDRFGKKPLFYTLQAGSFAFSSELSSLIRHKDIRSDFNEKALQKYYAYGYVPAPLSIYKRIHKLPAGYNLVVDIGSLNQSLKKYWDFVIEPFEKIPGDPIKEWGEEIRYLLRKAVKRRLIADVPLGIFLSGGMDSSSVAACAAEIAGRGAFKSFSIGFEEASFDESVPSKKAASVLGAEHHLRYLSLERAGSLLGELAERLDEPIGDSSLLPTYLLCRETRKHVTVAVGGDGADELFAGYDPFHALKAAELYTRVLPSSVHRGIRTIVSFLPVSHRYMSLDFKLKRALRGLDYPRKFWNPVWLGPLSPAEVEELFQSKIDLEDLYSEAVEQWDACTQENMIDKTLQFYTKLYLQDDILVKTDRASMMNSLEVRSPYLDIELVDFVRRIPSHYKYRRGITKYILKRALEPLLPQEILHRRKQGFALPLGEWFKNDFIRIDHFLDRDRGNPGFFRKAILEHRRGRADHRLPLWNYWLLQHFS